MKGRMLTGVLLILVNIAAAGCSQPISNQSVSGNAGDPKQIFAQISPSVHNRHVDFTITLINVAPSDVKQVTSEVIMPGMDMGSIPVTLKKVKDNEFTGSTSLPMSGQWAIQVDVKTTDSESNFQQSIEVQ